MIVVDFQGRPVRTNLSVKFLKRIGHIRNVDGFTIIPRHSPPLTPP